MRDFLFLYVSPSEFSSFKSSMDLLIFVVFFFFNLVCFCTGKLVL